MNHLPLYEELTIQNDFMFAKLFEDIDLQDGTEKIYVNCSGTNGSEYPQLQAFCTYVMNGIVTDTDTFVQEVDEKVQKGRKDPVIRKRVYGSEIQDTGRKIAYEQGHDSGLNEGTIKGTIIGTYQTCLSLGKTPAEAFTFVKKKYPTIREDQLEEILMVGEQE